MNDYSSINYTVKNDSPQYKIYEPPKPEGYWELVPGPHSFRIAVMKKPKWLHRKFITLCFGWTWHDGNLF